MTAKGPGHSLTLVAVTPGPGGHTRDTVQHRDGMWCQGDVITGEGEFTTSLPHSQNTGDWPLLALFGKKICLLWWAGHSTATLEWQGQLKAHHQAHDLQSQLGNVCDSLSFPVLVTHILNPCIHLLLQRRPLILNQLHHCCRALFIHLFRPMFLYRWPITGLQISACRTVKKRQCIHMNIACCMIYIPWLRSAVMTSFI